MAKDEVKKTEKEEAPINIQTVQPNVYKRIQKVRQLLVEANPKKSGKNTHTNAVYYELGDFLPTLNRLMDDQGIMTRFTIEKEKAVLIIFNVENADDKVAFYIPVAPAEVRAASAIQNLGAQITYLRRYLLMIAFEIAENDTVDTQKPSEVKEIDQIAIDKINATKTLPELNKTSKTIQTELGNDFRKSLVAHYTRRKKEIEDTEEEKMAEQVDEGLKKKNENT